MGHPQPVRVVRIMDRLNVGGPTKHAVWLSAGLAGDRFATTLVTGAVAAGEGDMEYFARAHGVDAVRIPGLSREISPRDVLVVARLVRLFFRLRPQIVHTHKAKAGATGRVAAFIYKWATPSALWLRPRRCRIVHTYHGHIFHGYYGRLKTALFLHIERALARLCTDRIVVISEQQRDEIHNAFGVGRPEQFQVIPLGIDLAEQPGPSADLRGRYGLARDEVTIGAVGRLTEVKNHALLLRAFARLIAGGTSARLFIVGDGHLRPDLERLAATLGIADRVVFLGFVEDTLAVYDDLDLVVLTSVNEGTPLTLIEGMSRGKAVAATFVGGVVDLMGAPEGRAGEAQLWSHGVTTAPGDAEAFAAAMRLLVERPDLRAEMGAQGRAFVRQRLSKERLLRDIEALYLDLTEEARAAERAA
jgi:glycosyltransferase involved in cell wall biosynthesis